MKILYAAPELDLSTVHGGTVHVAAVTRELLRHGHQVHLAVSHTASASLLPKDAVLHFLEPHHRFLIWRGGSEMNALLQTVRPDLVMERYYNFAGNAILQAKSLNIPSILEVNSPLIEYAGSSKSKADLLLLGALGRRRDAIAAAATLIVSPLKEIVPPQFAEKVRQIEWGADTDLFDPSKLPSQMDLRKKKGIPEDEIVFIHFGSLRKWHGLVDLLEAYDRVRIEIQRPSRLIILGPGDPITRNQVDFRGMVQHNDMAEWLKLSDAAVLPFSLSQHRYLELGFFWSPLKLFESMAMELPIITLNHPRITSLLRQPEGAVFYDGTSMDLARAMIEMSNRLPELREKAKSLRQVVLDHYSWRVHGDQLDSLIRLATSKS